MRNLANYLFMAIGLWALRFSFTVYNHGEHELSYFIGTVAVVLFVYNLLNLFNPDRENM
jgi:hypothetical protein